MVKEMASICSLHVQRLSGLDGQMLQASNAVWLLVFNCSKASVGDKSPVLFGCLAESRRGHFLPS